MRPSSRLTRSTMAATAALSVTSATTEIGLGARCSRLGDRRVRLHVIAPDDGDRGAGFRQPARHAKADAAIAAGDDGHLAVEVEESVMVGFSLMDAARQVRIRRIVIVPC